MEVVNASPSQSIRKYLVAGMIGIFLVALGGWYFASPWLALKNLKEAAFAGDTEVLRETVDFAAIRVSAKDQLKAQIVAELATKRSDNLEAMAAAMALNLVDPMIDGMISPAGIAAMVKSGQLNPDLSKQIEEIEWAVVRKGLSKFTAQRVGDVSDRASTMVFTRDGFGWVLTDIIAPERAAVDNQTSSIDNRRPEMPKSTSAFANQTSTFAQDGINWKNNEPVSGNCTVSTGQHEIMRGPCSGLSRPSEIVLTAEGGGCTIELERNESGARAKLYAYRDHCWIDERSDLEVENDIDLGKVNIQSGCWVGSNIRLCV